MSGVIIVAVIIAFATTFGFWFQANNGKVRKVAPAGPIESPVVLDAHLLGADLGDRATLVQFSTAFCQPCRATRRILDEVSTMVEGVAHVEIDAEANLDLVRALDIRRTPTVLVLDSRGHLIKKASGQPRKVDVIAALGEIPV